MEEANKLIGAGKKHLVMGKVVEAVNVLQEACSLLAKTYGDTADECGEAFFLCGKSLLDLARMENTVLGNALLGVPEEEEDGEDKPKDSNIESTENIDEKTRDELRVQVYDAMAEKENKTADAEKDGENEDLENGGDSAKRAGDAAKSSDKKDGDEKDQTSGAADDTKKGGEGVEMMEEAVEKKVEEAVEKKVEEAVEKKVEEAVEKKVEEAVEKKVEEAVEKKVEEAVEKKVEEAVEKKVKEAVEKKVEEAAEKKVEAAEKKVDEAAEKKVDEAAEKKKEKGGEKRGEEVKEGGEKKGEMEKKVEAAEKKKEEGGGKRGEEVKEGGEKKGEEEKKAKEGGEKKVKLGEEKKGEEVEEKMEEGEENGAVEKKGEKGGLEKEKVAEEKKGAEKKDCEEDAAKVPKESTDNQGEIKDEEEEEGDDDVEMEGDAEGQGDEGDATADKDSDDEEVGNLQLAWEMLEVAKVIYKRKESKDDQLMAAQSYLKLGEVSSESGNYTQALEDYQECLKIQLKHLDADSRLLAETHYQVGLTHDCLFQYSQAIEQFNSSISVINSRLAKLKEILDKAEGPDALPEERKEMEELQALLPEIQEKVEDATQTAAQAEKENDGSSVSATIARNGMDPPASTISPKSPAKVTVAKEEASKTPVSDISHLVRKKRKPEEESPVKEGVAKKVKADEKVDANGEQEKPHTNGDAAASSANKMEVESQ